MAYWDDSKDMVWNDVNKNFQTWDDLLTAPHEKIAEIKTALKCFHALPNDTPVPDDINKKICEIYNASKDSISIQPPTDEKWTMRNTKVLLLTIGAATELSKGILELILTVTKFFS